MEAPTTQERSNQSGSEVLGCVDRSPEGHHTLKAWDEEKMLPEAYYSISKKNELILKVCHVYREV